MEVGYPDHRRALVDTSAFVNLIPLSTLQAAGISERKIMGCLTEVTGFGGRDSVVVESRPHSFFSSVPCGENRGLLSYAFGEAVVA